MASDAEIDLVVNATRALSQVQRQMDDLVRIAQADTDPIIVQAAINRRDFLARQVPQLQRAVDEANARIGDIDIDVDVDEDRVRRLPGLLRNLGDGATAAAASVGRLGLTTASLGAAVSTAAPLVAGLVAEVAHLAPAAAVATQGMLAMQLVTGTLKVGLLGVQDAIEAAFDPTVKPADLAKQLKTLAPPARAFVLELQKLRPELTQIKNTVQGALFKGLSDDLKALSDTVLPDARSALRDTATTLNQMGDGAADAAVQLSENGTLGRALVGATDGLRNFNKLPAQVVTGLAQIAAAAAPVFDKLTAVAAEKAGEISKDLGEAFRSGALEDAINGAIDSIKQLGRIGGDIFATLGNILRASGGASDGLFNGLERITGALRDITASKGFQDTLRALSTVTQNLAQEAIPVLLEAFKAIAPVITTLAEALNPVIDALGPALQDVITAAAPVLAQLGTTIASIVTALTPFVSLAGTLVAAVLPLLTPALQLVQQLFDGLREPLAQLADALGPFIEQLAAVSAQLNGPLFDALSNIIEAGIPVLTVLLEGLAIILNTVVTPALAALSNLLNGDTANAFKGVQDASRRLGIAVGGNFRDFTNKATAYVTEWLSGLLSSARSQLSEFANFNRQALDNVVSAFRSLGHRVSDAVSGFNHLLYQIGVDLVRGLISGVESQVGALISSVANLGHSISGTISNILDIHSPSRVMRDIGRDAILGLQLGIQDAQKNLNKVIREIGFGLKAEIAAGVAVSRAETVTPTINVIVGGERLTQLVDYRIDVSRRRNTLLLSQGVRR